MLFYLFHLKIFFFFHSQDIQIYIFLSSLLFLQPLLEKMIEIPKVYDIMNWLNKNLRTCFVWYIEKESKCDIFIKLLFGYSMGNKADVDHCIVTIVTQRSPGALSWGLVIIVENILINIGWMAQSWLWDNQVTVIKRPGECQVGLKRGPSDSNCNILNN